MAFRKKHVRVTVELLNELLQEIRWKFNSSPAPSYLKKRLKHIHPIFHIVNRPNWYLYGQAYLCSAYTKKDYVKKVLKLRCSTHPTVIIEGEYYFAIIQINKGATRMVTKRGLRYLIAHEFAHILQIVIDHEVDDGYSYSTINDHDNRWYRFVKFMGGTGSELIPFKEIWC